MGSRTISTGSDVDAALSFLGKQKNVTGEELFISRIGALMQTALDEADSARFELAKKLLDEKNKGKSISDLRELLGL